MSHPKRVLVYKGRGVGPLSFRETIATLRSCLPTNYVVNSVDASDIAAGDVFQEAALFALPGGRDVPYDEDLRGSGNKQLRQFVENGGAFLGICAGGYYGASKVSFEVGHPLEITGIRELGFFPGEAAGTVYSPGAFCYDTEECAHAALLKIADLSFHAYYNGGCYFKDSAAYGPQVKAIGSYEDIETGPLTAIVQCQVGKGRAVLSGAHLDYRPTSLQGKVSQKVLQPLLESDSSRLQVVQNILQWLLVRS